MPRRVLLLALAASALWAELPPQAYREWQTKAPEYLEIKVDKASPPAAMKTVAVDVVATVVKVHRSATGLKAGDKIHILYTHEVYDRPIAGPSPIPLLHAGDAVPAFLAKGDKGIYQPAARGRSFSPLVAP